MKRINYRSKRLRVIAIFAIIAFFVSGLFGLSSAKAERHDNTNKDQEIEAAYYPENYSGYRYPVLPGTSLWPCEDYHDMIELSQIPNDILVTMPTSDLLQTVLANPIILMMYAYNNQGFEIVKSYCNSLQELCSRQDRVNCLYEYLLSHRDEFSSEMDLADNAYINYYNKRWKIAFFILSENPVFFPEGINNSDEVLTLINDIIVNDRNEISRENNRDPYPVSFYGFVDEGYDYLGDATAYGIYNQSMQAILFRAKERWLYSDGVYRTRLEMDFTSAAQTFLANEVYSLFGIYPDTYYGASVKYNCHAYAWCNENYRYIRWVNFFNNSGYSTSTMQNVSIGGVVVYYNSYGNNIGSGTSYSHSALVVGKYYSPYYGLNLKSKWGKYGLYSHTLGNCPYYYYGETSNPCDRLYFNP